MAVNTSVQCIYLHGFASGPQSQKAIFFAFQLESTGLSVLIPDLNEPEFASLTLTRQIKQVTELVEQHARGQQVVLLGSSMGGLLATMLCQRLPQVSALILFAPAFGLSRRWLGRMSAEQLSKWKTDGVTDIYHHMANTNLPLRYSFIEDAQMHQTDRLQVDVPTLLFHGLDDDLVPIAESRNFAEGNEKLVEMHELKSDHGLLNCLPFMWELSAEFLERYPNQRIERSIAQAPAEPIN